MPNAGASAGLVAQSKDLLMHNWRGFDGSNSAKEGFGGDQGWSSIRVM